MFVIDRHVRDILQVLKSALRPLVVSFIIVLILSAIFASLAEEIRDGDTLGFDTSILLAINHLSSSGLDRFFLVVTNFGDKFLVASATASLIAVMLWRRRVHAAAFVAVTIGGAALLNLILKLLFQRQRPELWQQIITETSFSFPSGHAMASSALAFCLIVLAWRTRYRWWVVGAALTYVVIIGFSRLYLGVHYPTDVIGGWLASLTWVTLCTAVLRRR